MNSYNSSLHETPVRWNRGRSNVQFRSYLFGTWKFSMGSNSRASASPFNNLTTSSDCCTFLRCSKVSNLNKRLSEYGDRLSGSLHGTLLSVNRLNRFWTRWIRRHHETWCRCQTTETFSKNGRTSAIQCLLTIRVRKSLRYFENKAQLLGRLLYYSWTMHIECLVLESSWTSSSDISCSNQNITVNVVIEQHWQNSAVERDHLTFSTLTVKFFIWNHCTNNVSDCCRVRQSFCSLLVRVQSDI